MEKLAVWAERLEGFVRVGTLWFERGGEEWLEYDGSYLQRSDATPSTRPFPWRVGASTRPRPERRSSRSDPRAASGTKSERCSRAASRSTEPCRR